MPLYSYQCRHCDRTEDAFRHIEQRKDGPMCCAMTMDQKITAPMLNQVWGGEYDGYRSMVTGEWVSSRKRHREILKEHDLIEVGNEMKPTGTGRPTV